MSSRYKSITLHGDDSISSNSSHNSNKSVTDLINKTEMIALEGRNPNILQFRSETIESEQIESDTSRTENEPIHGCIIRADSLNDQSSEGEFHSIIAYLLTELCVNIDNESEVDCILQKLYKYCDPTSNRSYYEMCQAELIHCNGHPEIVNAMKRYLRTSADIQQIGCRVLTASVCGIPTELKQVVVSSNSYSVLDVIVRVLQEYPNNEYVQMSACQFLANITTVSIESNTKRSHTEARNIKTDIYWTSLDDLVLLALQRFNLSMEMQRIGCLYFLNRSSSVSVIEESDHCTNGNNSKERHNAVIHTLLQAMLRFPKSRSLQYCCCATIVNFQRRGWDEGLFETTTMMDSSRMSVRQLLLTAVDASMLEFRNDSRIVVLGDQILSRLNCDKKIQRTK